jgi:diguanylate cyclase (GGDEF)-like protein
MIEPASESREQRNPSVQWRALADFVQELELGNNALVFVDDDQAIACCNPGARRLFQSDSDALRNRPLASLLVETPAGALGDLCRRVSREPPPRTLGLPRGVLLARCSDGQTTPIEGSISRVRVGAFQGCSLLLHDITDQVRSEERLHYLANHDALTGLPNRLALRDRLDDAIRRHHRSGAQFALLFVDLDNFKLINDQYGHLVGDTVLQACAERLVAASRETDVVARLGGDEFVILLEQLESPRELRLVTTRILQLLRGHRIRIGPHEIEAGASLGWALYPRDGRGADELLELADNAMYAHKRVRKHRTAIKKGVDNKELVPAEAVDDASASDVSNETASTRAPGLHRCPECVPGALSGSLLRFEQLKQGRAVHLAVEDLANVREEFERLSQARGQMLREAAHDIRGGLSVVTAACEVLRLHARENPSMAAVLDTMGRGLSAVNDMIDSLLDLSRLEACAEPVEVRSVDIAEMLSELASEHQTRAAEKGLALRCDGPESLKVRTDPRKVRRIAQNLLINALQHTREGEVRLSWAMDGRRWMLEVADTGPGLESVTNRPAAPPASVHAKHQRGSPSKQSRRPGGEGIGLTIVKRLCEVLDAGMSLESEPGRGTTFRVALPLEPSGPRSPDA